MIVLFVDLEEYSIEILHVVRQKATVLGRSFQANELQHEEVVF